MLRLQVRSLRAQTIQQGDQLAAGERRATEVRDEHTRREGELLRKIESVSRDRAQVETQVGIGVSEGASFCPSVFAEIFSQIHVENEGWEK